MHTRACTVVGCNSRSGSFHKFPHPEQQPERFRQWVKAAGNPRFRRMTAAEIYSRAFVCGLHFKKEDIHQTTFSSRVFKNAIPSLKVCNDESIMYLETESSTFQSMGTNSSPADIDYKLCPPEKCTISLNLEFIPQKYSEIEELWQQPPLKAIDSKETDLPPEEAQETIAGEKVLPDAGSPHATNYECSEIIIEEPFSEKIILLKEVPKVKNQINDKQKPYFSSIKSYVPATWVISEICRICLNSTNDLEVIPLNEKSDSTMVNIIKTVLPDLDLDIFSNNMICSQCSDSLAECYRFNKMWLAADEKLKKVIETKKHEIDGKSDLMIIAEPKEVPQEESNPPVIYPGKRPTLKSLWGLGPYICEICGAIHNKIKSFLRHLQRHQIKKLQPQLPRKQKTKRVMCELCGHLCFTAISLKKHHAEVHQEHKCTICGKEFKTHYSLQRHVKITHLKLGCRQCHYCGKQLHDSNGLRQHLRSHSVKMYSCQVCNKKFTNPVLVKKHSRIHNPTPSSCEYCGKCVKYESSLKKHIKIYHKHEGGYKCDFCGKVYWKNWDLKRHKLLVHGYSENRSER